MTDRTFTPPTWEYFRNNPSEFSDGGFLHTAESAETLISAHLRAGGSLPDSMASTRKWYVPDMEGQND